MKKKITSLLFLLSTCFIYATAQISLSPAEITFAAEGGTAGISVDYDGIWNPMVNSEIEWIEVLPPASNDFFSIVVSPNTSTESRGCPVEVYDETGKGLLATLQVWQAGVSGDSIPELIYGCTDPDAGNFNPQANVDNGSCEYGGGEISIHPEYLEFETRADFKYVSVTYGERWYASVAYENSWISVLEIDSATIQVSVSENTTAGTRTGNVEIYADATKTYLTSLPVIQSGNKNDSIIEPEFSFSPSYLEFGSESSEAAVTVQSTINWYTEINAEEADWIRAVKSDNGDLYVSVDANDLPDTRHCNINIYDAATNQFVTSYFVSQQGNSAVNPYIYFSADSLYFGAPETTWFVAVNSNVRWSVENDCACNWLNVGVVENQGIQIDISENNTGNSRAFDLVLMDTDSKGETVRAYLHIQQAANNNVPEIIYGCKDSLAINYNPAADIHEPNMCEYENPELIFGCTDPNATNYDPQANTDDKSCEYIGGEILLYPEYLEFEAEADFKSVSVTYSERWYSSVTYENNWISVLEMDSATIQVSVLENTGTQARTGSVDIYAEATKTLLASLPITQQGSEDEIITDEIWLRGQMNNWLDQSGSTEWQLFPNEYGIYTLTTTALSGMQNWKGQNADGEYTASTNGARQLDNCVYGQPYTFYTTGEGGAAMDIICSASDFYILKNMEPVRMENVGSQLSVVIEANEYETMLIVDYDEMGNFIVIGQVAPRVNATVKIVFDFETFGVSFEEFNEPTAFLKLSKNKIELGQSVTLTVSTLNIENPTFEYYCRLANDSTQTEKSLYIGNENTFIHTPDETGYYSYYVKILDVDGNLILQIDGTSVFVDIVRTPALVGLFTSTSSWEPAEIKMNDMFSRLGENAWELRESASGYRGEGEGFKILFGEFPFSWNDELPLTAYVLLDGIVSINGNLVPEVFPAEGDRFILTLTRTDEGFFTLSYEHIPVEQPISLSVESLEFEAEGGSQFFSVSYAGEWYPAREENETWVSTAKMDSVTVRVTVEPNSETQARTGTVFIVSAATKRAIATLPIMQKANDSIPQYIFGCTNPTASNYDRNATKDDGSCVFQRDTIFGCTDPSAENYSEIANVYDGSCIYPDTIVLGCMDTKASNYTAGANIDDGSCVYEVIIAGCTDSIAKNYNAEATTNNGTCEYETVIWGCRDTKATNYNAKATKDDGYCQYAQEIKGCTDRSAENYMHFATVDDGSCIYPQPEPEVLIVYGCTDRHALNYNQYATDDNGSCTYRVIREEIEGCTDEDALNYNPVATVSTDVCVYNAAVVDIYGCTDPKALNYNTNATLDDETCVYARPINSFVPEVEITSNDTVSIKPVSSCELNPMLPIDSAKIVATELLSANTIKASWVVYQDGNEILYDAEYTVENTGNTLFYLSVICKSGAERIQTRTQSLRAAANQNTAITGYTIAAQYDVDDTGHSTFVPQTSNAAQLNVYPNPFNTMLNINIDHVSKETVSIELYSIEGQLQSVYRNTNQIQINTTGLPEGLYLLRVRYDDNRMETVKLIKK